MLAQKDTSNWEKESRTQTNHISYTVIFISYTEKKNLVHEEK